MVNQYSPKWIQNSPLWQLFKPKEMPHDMEEASDPPMVQPGIASLGCHSMPNVQQPQWSDAAESNSFELADFVKGPLCTTRHWEKRWVFTLSLFGWAIGKTYLTKDSECGGVAKQERGKTDRFPVFFKTYFLMFFDVRPKMPQTSCPKSLVPKNRLHVAGTLSNACTASGIVWKMSK